MIETVCCCCVDPDLKSVSEQVNQQPTDSRFRERDSLVFVLTRPELLNRVSFQDYTQLGVITPRPVKISRIKYDG